MKSIFYNRVQTYLLASIHLSKKFEINFFIAIIDFIIEVVFS